MSAARRQGAAGPRQGNTPTCFGCNSAHAPSFSLMSAGPRRFERRSPMTSSQSPNRILPARPSLDSLRKQAKKLVREVAAETADAIARVRLHLPGWAPPLMVRDAQLVVAREYGFSGWKDLREEVMKRTGH